VRRPSAWCACAAGLLAPAAHAQGFEQFTPTPAGDWSFGVESAGIETESVAVSAVTDYARDPVVMRSDGEVVGAIVSDQLAAHFGVSAALHGRVVFFVNAPFVLYQSGDDPYDARTGMGFGSPQGAELGNVSFGARIALLTQRPRSVGVALSLRFFFPSGDYESYVNGSSPAAVFSAVVGSSGERWSWSTQAGLSPPPDIYDDERPLSSGEFNLRFGAALACFVGRQRLVSIGGHLRAVQPIERHGGDPPSVEALAEGRLRLGTGDWFASLAAGPGLTGPVGVPLFRALLGLSYAPAEDP